MEQVQPLVEDDFEPLKVAVVFGRALCDHFWEKGKFSNDLENILRTHGVTILTPSDITKPGMYWARDPLFVVDHDAFVAPQDGRRHEEHGLIQEMLTDHHIPSTTTDIHGGDILLPDKQQLLLGINRDHRKDISRICAAMVAATKRTIVPIKHWGVHLDTCIAPLPDERILIHPERITAESRLLLEEALSEERLCEVPALATDKNPILNLLWLNRTTVLVPANGIADLLRHDGYTVIEMEGGKHDDGNVRCAVAPLIRGSAG